MVKAYSQLGGTSLQKDGLPNEGQWIDTCCTSHLPRLKGCKVHANHLDVGKFVGYLDCPIVCEIASGLSTYKETYHSPPPVPRSKTRRLWLHVPVRISRTGPT